VEPDTQATLPSSTRPEEFFPPPVHNPFPISPAAGPWVICAAHYAGPDGFELALQVTKILREKHHLSAFLFSHCDEQRRKQFAEWMALKKQSKDAPTRPRPLSRIRERFAVLVAGGYKDPAAASAALPSVRNLPMPALKLESGRTAYEYLHYSEASPD